MSAIEAPPRPTPTPNPEPPKAPLPERSTLVGAWPVALRLARREVRRRPGRTILVMALVLLPVFFMTSGSVFARSDTSPSFFGGTFEVENSIRASPGFEGLDEFGASERAFVGSDTGVATPDDPVVRRDAFTDAQIDALVALLVGRADVLPVARLFTDVSGASVTTFMELAEWPTEVNDALVTQTLDFDSGRPPTAAGEILLSRGLAEKFAVETGDELILTAPERRWRVSGVARQRNSYGNPIAFVTSLDRNDILPDQLDEGVLVLPRGNPTQAELSSLADEIGLALNTSAVSINNDSFFGGNFDETTQALAWG